jgi:hypothetical protein
MRIKRNIGGMLSRMKKKEYNNPKNLNENEEVCVRSLI